MIRRIALVFAVVISFVAGANFGASFSPRALEVRTDDGALVAYLTRDGAMLTPTVYDWRLIKIDPATAGRYFNTLVDVMPAAVDATPRGYTIGFVGQAVRARFADPIFSPLPDDPPLRTVIDAVWRDLRMRAAEAQIVSLGAYRARLVADLDVTDTSAIVLRDGLIDVDAALGAAGAPVSGADLTELRKLLPATPQPQTTVWIGETHYRLLLTADPAAGIIATP